MTFLNPVPNGKMKTSTFSNEVEFISYKTDTVLCPFEGVVISTDKLKCGGYVKIEHFVNGDTYYSNFCNVERIMVFHGNQVKRGQIIGVVGDNPIQYSITNKYKSKQDVSLFLSGSLGTSNNSNKDDKKEKERKEKVKKEKEKKEKDSLSNYNPKKSEGAVNPFMDVLLSPFSLLSSALKLKKESVDDTNEILKEEISEIKKLINY
jgi:hypothetical protein